LDIVILNFVRLKLIFLRLIYKYFFLTLHELTLPFHLEPKSECRWRHQSVCMNHKVWLTQMWNIWTSSACCEIIPLSASYSAFVVLHIINKGYKSVNHDSWFMMTSWWVIESVVVTLVRILIISFITRIVVKRIITKNIKVQIGSASATFWCFDSLKS